MPARGAPTGTELEHARRTFIEAEADEDAGRWQDALEKLRSVGSVRLTAGVRYHIALCEERLGHLARALGEYQAAETQARGDGAQDVLRLVGRQLAALDPRVPRLTVHVVPDLPDASLIVDGDPIDRTARPIVLDPGAHRVEATAPNRPRTAVFVTLQEHDATVLDLKLADPWPSSLPPSAPASPARSRSVAAPLSAPPVTGTVHGSHASAIVFTALTVALAAGGVVAYVVAGSEHDRDVGDCGSLPPSASVQACDSLKNRVRAWDFAAAGGWAGAALAGVTAIVLWPKPPRDAAPMEARLAVGPAAIRLEGRF